MAARAPSGTVTFLFTDIEGSTRLWDAYPEGMESALSTHNEILRSSIERHGGYVFATGGDGFCVSFHRAGEAVQAAVAGQAELGAHHWPADVQIRVRMGLHTGEAVEQDGDYLGSAVNRAARIMALGHGGQILCSSATAELLDGQVLLDLGAHQVPGVSVPLRVFQVGGGLFPSLPTAALRLSNLPAELSGFVGREEELAAIVDALGSARMVTVTGMGGVGKTRSALRVATDALGRYRDGVWLVELAPLADAVGLVEVVARAVRVPDRQGQPLAASLLDFLRAKELLVVLDNCEHLGDGVAGWASGMLSACPGVRVLATSRRQLGVRGERIVALSPLRVPSFGASLAELEQLEAARLFVERAYEAKATFRLTEANAAAVSRLVRLLDGIPLAIELAAARVRVLSPSELADLFEQSGPTGGFEPLRHAIAWSYGLLSDMGRAALNRASVFAGDFDLAAARAVISTDPIDAAEVVEQLLGLVDQSLLIANEHDGPTRYRLLETIRQYAHEQLDATGEGHDTHRRHAEHYAQFATAADEGLRGRDEIVWTERLEAELDNLRAALGWSVAVGDVDLALRLVASLTAAAFTGFGYHAAATWAAVVVAMPGAQAHPRYPEVLAWEGFAAMTAGNSDAARRTYLAAVDAAGNPGADVRSVLRVFRLTVTVASWTSEVEEALRLYERWAESARAAGDDGELALALAGSAVLLAQADDVSAAVTRTDEAMTLARRLGNPTALCSAAVCAGLVRMTTDDEAALRFFAESHEVAESVGNQLVIGSSLANQAWIHAQRGEWRQAAPLAARSLGVQHRAGDQAWFRHWIGLATVILEAAGDDEAAATLSPHGALSVLPVIGAQALTEQVAASEEAMRRRLGDDRFETWAARGRAMDDDEIASYADERLAQVTPQGRLSPPGV
jgi:predicted ATPase/class 3 adenylate cyclase